MLVLGRKESEEIVVGDIRIMVCEIKNGRVRIGIQAPDSVNIYRAELTKEEPK